MLSFLKRIFGGVDTKQNTSLLSELLINNISNSESAKFTLYVLHSQKRREVFGEGILEELYRKLRERGYKMNLVLIDTYENTIEDIITEKDTFGRYRFNNVKSIPDLSDINICIDLCPCTLTPDVLNAYIYFITELKIPVYILDNTTSVLFEVNIDLLQDGINDILKNKPSNPKEEFKKVRFNERVKQNKYIIPDNNTLSSTKEINAAQRERADEKRGRPRNQYTETQIVQKRYNDCMDSLDAYRAYLQRLNETKAKSPEDIDKITKLEAALSQAKASIIDCQKVLLNIVDEDDKILIHQLI